MSERVFVDVNVCACVSALVRMIKRRCPIFPASSSSELYRGLA